MANLFNSILEATKNLQTKILTATASSTTVVPDTGYDALDEVVINPQEHDDYYPSSSSYDSRGSGTSEIDLGEQNSYRYVRVRNTSGSSYYEAIRNVVLYQYWKFNDSGYNSRTVTISVSGLSTGSHYNYILLVCGRNYNTSTDVSLSASSGTLTSIASYKHTFTGTSGNTTYYIFYKWQVSSSSATLYIDRGSSNYYATYNLTVYN